MEPDSDNPLSPTAHALNVDIVVDLVLSYLDKYPKNLIPYRLVCHKWNDLIVRKIKKTGRSFRIPLTYESHVPQIIDASGGRRGTGEVLDTAVSTLTGTAAKLHFNTVIIARDFYLAGVMPQFTKFLGIQGQFIHHIKINIRAGKRPMPYENHVTDCAEVVSMESLRALFRGTPNLKTLYFCVRFSHFEDEGTKPTTGVLAQEQRCIYPFTLPPQLQRLTAIGIDEPDGVRYSVELLKKLMTLASLAGSSNLRTLSIKPTKQLYNFALAMKAVSEWHRLGQSLTTLYISHADVDSTYLLLEKGTKEFSYLSRLRSLTLNKISGYEKYSWIRSLLHAHQSNLKVLVLGEEKLHVGEDEDWLFDPEIGDDEESLFPPVMENLERLNINLSEFNEREHVSVESYETQFPKLKTFVITGCVHENEDWMFEHLEHLFPGVGGQSETLKDFHLKGNIDGEDEKIAIVCGVNGTFPMANIHLSSQ